MSKNDRLFLYILPITDLLTGARSYMCCSKWENSHGLLEQNPESRECLQYKKESVPEYVYTARIMCFELKLAHPKWLTLTKITVKTGFPYTLELQLLIQVVLIAILT